MVNALTVRSEDRTVVITRAVYSLVAVKIPKKLRIHGRYMVEHDKMDFFSRISLDLFLIILILVSVSLNLAMTGLGFPSLEPAGIL